MTQYAMDEDALVFVKIGEIHDVEYFAYVTTPLWEDESEYVVRNDMTVAEAKHDAIETFNEYHAERAAYNASIEQAQFALEIQKV